MVYAMPFDGKPCCNIQLLKVSAASPQNLSGTRATHQNHTDKAYQQQMQARKQKSNYAPKSIRYFKACKDLKGLVRDLVREAFKIKMNKMTKQPNGKMAK